MFRSMEKMHSDVRELVLKPIEGKKATSGSGLVDPRLFKGGNKLHAYKDTTGYMWGLRYESGTLPIPLKQKFTSFDALLKFAQGYFNRRNLEIVEVVDRYA